MTNNHGDFYRFKSQSELGINISNSVETPEGMLEFIAGNARAEIPVPSPCMKLMTWPDGVIRETHQMTIVANEFIDFISKNQEGWTSMLNNIYDEDMYNYRTKNKGENVLTGPYICLLGAIPTEPFVFAGSVSDRYDLTHEIQNLLRFLVGARQYNACLLYTSPSPRD
ncbi:MAG: hypothetical protein EBW73_09490, partial [Betaproteobacteria bacterium]|nr:hypothetical protein [Betaproteobacteria bacterium]